ncbi:Ig-like domain-containing protein [Archangium violaceum]|uniref:Ig-like domain-containing protein n=1 Tax=Archangium violaceum TaxID=83451 RepID=UPI00193B70D1|nr:Ig-like domain-containing protein [Archangium violaceum]QRK10130.1 Ig-like domain-containing protein [Archangium violaceum]
MRLTMYQWVGMLWAGLLLVGCGDDAPELPRPPLRPLWSSDNRKVANDNQPRLKARVESAALEVYLGPNCEGTFIQRVEDSDAYYTEFSLSVPDNSTTVISLRAVKDDRVSECSEPFTYTEDSIPPPAPRWAEGNPVLGKDSNIVLRVIAEPGTARVALHVGDECEPSWSSTATPDATGMASLSGYVSFNKKERFFAMALDEAGNVSECSAVHAYTRDSNPPAAPRWSSSTPRTANRNDPSLTLDVEAGAQVELFANPDCTVPALETVTAGASGQALFTVTVADDSTSLFSAWARDAAGNRSGCSAALEYIEDSQSSAAPSVLVLSPSSPGSSSTVSVSGRAAGGDPRALLFTTEGCVGTFVAEASAAGSGSFIVTTSVPRNSTTSFFVATEDAAGNRSACVGPLVYVQDGVPPSVVGAKVANGPGAHQGHQRATDVFEANWSGFSDSNGVVLYEHVISVSSRCQGYFTESLHTTEQTSTRLTGFSLWEDGPFFHCVRAKDAAGNWSPFVASEGFWVDLTPPSVASVSPTQDAVAVDILAPIRFTFSEPVDVSSLTPEGFSLEVRGTRVATTMTCDDSATSCAFTPVSPLPYRETVRAVLSAPVKDRAGWAMTSSVTVGFTTRGREWQPPREVHSVRPGLFPDVAVDGQGHALAIWVQDTSGVAFRPFASRYLPHVGWEPARELDTVHPGDVERPAVAVNEVGFGVAVWELHVGSQVDLYAVEYSPGSGWSTPHLLETRAEPVSTPRVGVDAQGNALVVWRQSDGGAESLWAARLVKDGGWSAPLLLESGPGATSVPTLALEGSGRALVAWLQPDSGGTPRVQASRFVPGSGWTPPEQAAASGEGTSVSAALSADGSAFILFRWRDAGTGSSSLYATRFVPGEGWREPTAALGDAPPGGDDPAVAMDRWGRAMVSWTGPRTGSSTVFLKRFTPENGWQPVAMDQGQSVQPSVAADGQGNFHIVWVENVSGVDRVFGARYPEGATTLSFIGALEPVHGGTSKRPRVRANGAGAAVTVWYRDNGGGFSSNLVHATVYE